VDRCDYYELLGVPPHCNRHEIQTAFHRFAESFHPDVHPDATQEEHRLLVLVFQRGAEAYRTLADPARRVRYDMGLARGERRLSHERASQRPLNPGPIDLSCRSAGAKLAAKQAQKLLLKGALEPALELLRQALGYDGGVNPALQALIADTELRLFLSESQGR